MTGFDKSWLPHKQQQDVISLSHKLYTILLAVQIKSYIGAKIYPGCICYSLFLRLVRLLRVVAVILSSMTSSSLDKVTAAYKSPHNWLVKLTDLAALCDMWSWKWYQSMPFGHFQFLKSHFLPFCGSHYPTLHPYKRDFGINYVFEKLYIWNGWQFC